MPDGTTRFFKDGKPSATAPETQCGSKIVPEASTVAAVLADARATPPSLDWFMLSPSALFGSYNPGVKTGTFRLGGDQLISDADGTSDISGADYAIAFIDEIESPAHSRQRFTAGY